MSTRWLIRGVACGAALVASATRSWTPGAEPESRFFCTQFEHVNVARMVPGPDGSVFVAGIAKFALLVGGVPVGSDYGPLELFVARIAPGGAIDRVSRAELAYPYDGDLQRMALAADGSVWVAGFGQIRPVGSPDYGDAAGSRSRDVWIAKFAPDGALAFATNIGGMGHEVVNAIAPTADGDAALVGTTSSPNFPVVGAFQPAYGGGGPDGFVALIRGDGSGLAWSSYLGGAGSDDANAAAVTADGGILVASRSRDSYWDTPSPYESDTVRTLYSATLTRLSRDGAVLSATSLPFSGHGGVFALAEEPDGRILAGGAASPDTSPESSEARLVRLSADGTSLEGVWSAPDPPVRLITRAPDGNLFAGYGSRLNYLGEIERRAGGRVVAATLDDAEPQVDLRRYVGYGGTIAELVMAPDGALCVLGYGRCLPFGDAPRSASSSSAFVSRMPLSGADAPSRLRVVAKGRRWADVAWSGDGDPVATYGILRSADKDPWGWPTFARVAVTPRSARSVQLTGLRPGHNQFVRVVAEFPSGVRAFVPETETFRTEPDAVTRVRAFQPWYQYGGCGPAVIVGIHSPNGNGTHYEVELQSGAGPWIRVDRVKGSDHFVTHACDYTHSRTGEARVYRARAVVDGVRTDWVESNLIFMR